MTETRRNGAFTLFSLWPQGCLTPSAGAEALLEAQRDWLAAVEGAMTGFLHRRREEMQRSVDMIEQARRCRSWGDVLSLQQELLTRLLQRVAEEISACTETALLLSRLGAKHVEEAGRAVFAGAVPQTAVEKPKAKPAKAA